MELEVRIRTEEIENEGLMVEFWAFLGGHKSDHKLWAYKMCEIN